MIIGRQRTNYPHQPGRLWPAPRLRHCGNRPAADGFTLLEVMAAVVIIGFAVIALLQVQGSIMMRTMNVRDRARALVAAENALDAFLVQPDFGDLSRSDYIDQRADIQLNGFDDFLVTRILQDRLPLEDQETVELHPELAEEILDRRLEAISKPVEGAAPGDTRGNAAATSSGEEAFDPGEFVAVRVEVRRESDDKLLATLETWLPKPPREEVSE